jgi:hypothetical protein
MRCGSVVALNGRNYGSQVGTTIELTVLCIASRL